MKVAARDPRSGFNRVGWMLATGVWLCAIGIGLVAMARFDWTEGRRGAAPARWPAETTLDRVADRPTLVVAIHPLCPCGRASIDLLARLVAENPGRLELIFLVLMPERADPAWANAPSWHEARAIPGARVVADPRGIESAQFGAKTSGHAVLFDSAGQRLFDGGLTIGRGLAAPGAGLQAVENLLSGETLRTSTAPVFGCDLFAVCEQCGPISADGGQP